MIFFKHYTEASEGTLNELINRAGMEAYGQYWRMVEMCVKKLKKKDDGEFAESDMDFTFNSKQVRDNLRIKSKRLEIFLGILSELNLCSATQSEDKVRILFPKILEILDRDSKRPRRQRGDSASDPRLIYNTNIKNKREIQSALSCWKFSDRESFEELVARHDFANQLFLGNNPLAEKAGGLVAFAAAISPEDQPQFIKAIENYFIMLSSLSWKREPKGSLKSFIDADFWKSWIDVPPSPTDAQIAGIFAKAQSLAAV